jgi:hypothetical protein
MAAAAWSFLDWMDEKEGSTGNTFTFAHRTMMPM